MKFYPADWRADAMLRLCSIGARGLWAEMMCIMHDAEHYGSLLVNGRRIDKKQLAGLAGISEKECTALLMELEGNGVFSRDDDGTIYSRRMRRDHEKAIKDKENGRGGGNPKLKGGVNPQDNGGDKAHIPNATSKEEDRIRDARATSSSFTEGSKALSSAFWKALGFESALAVHPDYAGTDWRAIEWEKAGWTVDLIDTETRRVGPDKPLTYYEKVFASSFAKRQAPLPIVEIREAEKLTVTHGKPPGRYEKTQSLSDVARRHAEAGISFGERPTTPSVCVIPGGPDVRLLPQGGSERPGDLCSGDVSSPERILAGRD